MDKENEAGILDVAVVGAGVSGLYSAWRLIGADGGKPYGVGAKPRIKVFEAGTRIGGRLLSLRPPNMPHVPCELGGMRYMSNQPLIKALVEDKFEIPTIPLPVNDPNNIAFLRGKHLRLGQLTDPTAVPYDLPWRERGKDPSSLVGYAIDQIVPTIKGLGGKDLSDALKVATIEKEPITNKGFWNVLAMSLSSEGFAFARDSGGYDCTTLNWNAYDTILLNCDFTPNVTYTGFKDGYESIPKRLYDEFKAAGGDVEFENGLRSVDKATLSDGSEGVSLVFKNGATVEARHVVLAMPRRSLELLDQTGPLFKDEEFRRMLVSVTPIPLFKMFVAYDFPWWESVGVTQGRSVTDLPLRQIYYWGTEGKRYPLDAKNLHSVIMASYDDTLNVGYWNAYHGSQTVPPKPTQQGVDRWEDYAAPEAMMWDAHRQLMRVHDVEFAPDPTSAVYRDWSEDPFGGGVNFWNIRERSWEIIPKMVHPVETIQAFVCGEAYSDGQGWVEGALNTAERVLQKLGLDKPVWANPPQAPPFDRNAAVVNMSLRSAAKTSVPGGVVAHV